MSHDIKLTPKQYKFCEYYISGLSGKDSYLKAYETKCNDTTAYTEAARLLSREDINEYLKILRKPLEEKARTTVISEREKKRSVLWSIVEAPDSTYNDKCRALDLLNKMDAEYININKTIDETSEKLDLLDVDALKSILKPSDGV